jgi:hypothetical protein
MRLSNTNCQRKFIKYEVRTQRIMAELLDCWVPTLPRPNLQMYCWHLSEQGYEACGGEQSVAYGQGIWQLYSKRLLSKKGLYCTVL